MSCNITVSVSDDFAKEAKRLAKKYPSFKQDYKEFLDSIKENPLQGDEITKNIRKIRMAIKAKGKGKSGGARVITFNVFTDVENGHVVFLLLYDKEDASTVKVNVVKQLVRDMGFDIEQNLTGVFITYKTDDTKSKWYHRFLYN